MSDKIKICRRSILEKRIEDVRKICDNIEMFILPMIDDEDQFVALNSITRKQYEEGDENQKFTQEVSRLILERKN